MTRGSQSGLSQAHRPRGVLPHRHSKETTTPNTSSRSEESAIRRGEGKEGWRESGEEEEEAVKDTGEKAMAISLLT